MATAQGKILESAKVIPGSYSGTTGKSTFAFLKINRSMYSIVGGTCFGACLVTAADGLKYRYIDASGYHTVDIAGNNYTFELPGIDWYCTPYAICNRLEA